MKRLIVSLIFFVTIPFTYAQQTYVPDDPGDSWQSHLYYPFVKSDKTGSEIAV
jgi:hypothetical protein